MAVIVPGTCAPFPVSPGEQKKTMLVMIPAAATNDTLDLSDPLFGFAVVDYVHCCDITAGTTVACTYVVATSVVTLTGIGGANASSLFVCGDAQ